jgi:hypothetical protein
MKGIEKAEDGAYHIICALRIGNSRRHIGVGNVATAINRSIGGIAQITVNLQSAIAFAAVAIAIFADTQMVLALLSPPTRPISQSTSDSRPAPPPIPILGQLFNFAMTVHIQKCLRSGRLAKQIKKS